MKIGCHAVLFGEKIASETDKIVGLFAATSCDGIEVGSRFFDENTEHILFGSLSKYDLQLSGLHASIHLTDLVDDPQKVYQYLEKISEILRGKECDRIILTGMPQNENLPQQNLGDVRLENPEFLKKAAQKLDFFAKNLLEEKGIYIYYHNHNWEFFRDGLIYNILFENTKTLKFALDIGWAETAGYDAVSLIERQPERFNYLHLRDFRKKDVHGLTCFSDVQPRFVNIGEGDMKYPTLMKRLSQVTEEDTWFVIEYEKGAVDISRYERAVAAVKSMM